MLADTSDIRDFSRAQHQHAANLTTVAADLAAARLPADGFGSVGAHFLTTLNAALMQQAHLVAHVADRLGVAGSTASEAADAYEAAERAAGQTLSTMGR